MSSVSAEQPAFCMGPLPWSFFSDHSSGNDSVFLMSPRRSGGLNLNENQFSSSSNSDYMNSPPSRFAGGRGFEDDRGGLSIPDFTDMSCGYNDGMVFEGQSNGDVSSFIQKDGRGGDMGVRIGNAVVGSPSPRLEDVICALQKYLPSNNEDEESLPAVDAYSCDEFRMYEFKVRRCMRGRSHDWTECPFAHPGEKARRRDPRRFHYSGTACPDFRKGACRRGDACEFAHGVFECWLHPARYRTQPCKDGRSCKRRVCFFAHTPQQLRMLPGLTSPSSNSRNAALHAASALKSYSLSASAVAYDGSPLRHALEGVAGSSPPCGSMMSSPTSTLMGHSQSPPPLSPPLSPSASPPLSPEPAWSNTYRLGLQKAVLNRQIPGHRRHLERLSSMPSEASRGMQASPRLMALSETVPQQQSSKAMVDLVNSLQSLRLKESSVPSWLQVQAQMVNGGGGHGSPRASNLRHCVVQSLPCTPTHSENTEDMGEWFEEPVQRVESGKDLRAKIYARLTRENLLQDSSSSTESPDVGWVNELVK